MRLYLVRSVSAENVEWRRNELGLDRHSFGALFLACTECLLDGVDTSGGVACKLDVGSKLDGLRSETAGDGRCEDGEGRCGDGFRES